MVVIKSHTLRTIKEEFDEYELEDGNILRVKHVLITFGFTEDVKKDEKGNKLVKTLANSQLVTGVIPTKEIDTSNLKLNPSGVVNPSEYVKKVNFKPQKTHLNIYETDEAIIFIRNNLVKVWATPYKDKNDFPMYHVEAQAQLTAQSKPPKINPESPLQ